MWVERRKQKTLLLTSGKKRAGIWWLHNAKLRATKLFRVVVDLSLFDDKSEEVVFISSVIASISMIL